MELPAGTVHVWSAELDRLTTLGGTVLAADERERAARFVSERDRVRWARSREVLRRLLGRYLERDPAEIELSLEARGRPALADGELDFNLSHSHGLALFAFARGLRVGVDVERATRVRDPLRLAERVFVPADVTRLRELPEPEREAEFLRLWARHEAALKCQGAGLGDAVDREALWLRDLDAGAEAAAAVAASGEPRSLRMRELTPELLAAR